METKTMNCKRCQPAWLSWFGLGILFLMVCHISSQAIGYKYLKLEVTGGASIEIVNLDWMVNSIVYHEYTITAFELELPIYA